MNLSVYSAPAIEPLTLDEVMYHCRIDDYSQEAASEIILLNSLIVTARKQAETNLKRYLITQTLDLTLDRFPTWEIKLPPIQSVTSISYVDNNGDTQVLSASLYLVDSTSEPARITPAYGEVWPSARWQNNSVTIRFVAGYGDSASDVPDCIKNWMLMRIKTLYDGRDQLVSHNGELSFTDQFIDGLLDSERVTSYL